jgi:hypothetical protein
MLSSFIKCRRILRFVSSQQLMETRATLKSAQYRWFQKTKDDEKNEIEQKDKKKVDSIDQEKFKALTDHDEEKSKLQAAIDWVKKFGNFYWQGTKQMYYNVQKAQKLRREIAFRLFRRANRRETMFVNNVVIDIVKFIPAGTLFMLPGGTFTLPLLAYLFPVLMPSVYQHPDYLKRARKKHYIVRLKNSAIVVDEFMNMTSEILADPNQSEHHLEASLLQAMINNVRDSRTYDTGTKNFIRISTQVLHDLQKIDNNIHGLFHTKFTIGTQQGLIKGDLLKSMILFLMITKHEYNGISGVGARQVNAALTGSGSGAVHLPILKYFIMIWAEANYLTPEWVRIRGLKAYLQQIRYDDLYIRHFGVSHMTLEEIMQALYVRGFNVHEQGQMKFFSLNELQELMASWIQFTSKVKSDCLVVFAQTLLWWP